MEQQFSTSKVTGTCPSATPIYTGRSLSFLDLTKPNSRILRPSRRLQTPCSRSHPSVTSARSSLAIARRPTPLDPNPPCRTRPIRHRLLWCDLAPDLSKSCSSGLDAHRKQQPRRWIPVRSSWRTCAGRKRRAIGHLAEGLFDHIDDGRGCWRCPATSNPRSEANTIPQGTLCSMRR